MSRDKTERRIKTAREVADKLRGRGEAFEANVILDLIHTAEGYRTLTVAQHRELEQLRRRVAVEP